MSESDEKVWNGSVQPSISNETMNGMTYGKNELMEINHDSSMPHFKEKIMKKEALLDNKETMLIDVTDKIGQAEVLNNVKDEAQMIVKEEGIKLDCVGNTKMTCEKMNPYMRRQQSTSKIETILE